jgi:hypothetical protein
MDNKGVLRLSACNFAALFRTERALLRAPYLVADDDASSAEPPRGAPFAFFRDASARFGVASREKKAYIGMCEKNRRAICATEEFRAPD